MSDEPKSDLETTQPALPESDTGKRPHRVWSDEEIYSAIVAWQMNGGNINRTCIAMGVPYATLHGWIKDYEAGNLSVSIVRGVKEQRGNMAAKLESVIHSALEAAPSKLPKASFSQTMVGVGIGLDKLRNLRKLDEDPTLELCRLLKLSPDELPANLQLEEGEEIPEEFIEADYVETISSPEDPNNFEPQQPPEHAPDCLGFVDINDQTFKNCSCKSAPEPKDDDDEPVN